MSTTKVQFLVNEPSVDVLELDEDLLQDNLQPRLYSVGHLPGRGFFLNVIGDHFDLPSKLYGNIEARADKVVHAYNDRPSSTGVLSTGDKGAGKTELSKLICNKMLAQDIPVIVVNEPYSGDEFNQFINKLGEICIFFDEFVKIYNKNENSNSQHQPQNDLLTLLQGTASKKRLIVITENNEWLINDYMKNRPGRIYYHFRYDKIDESVISDYCIEFNIPQSIIGKITYLHNTSLEFSFDILKALVEEYLRYPNEDFDSLVADLNVKETKQKMRFVIDKFTPIGNIELVDKEINNFLGDDEYFVYYRDKSKTYEHGKFPKLYFDDEYLKAVSKGKYVYEIPRYGTLEGHTEKMPIWNGGNPLL